MAESAECPPDPRRGERSGLVVGNHQIALADAECAHRIGEHGCRRQHVRQRVRLVADAVDVEEPGAGDVGGGVFRTRIPAAAGQMEAAVEQPHACIVQMPRQPVD